MDTITTAPQKPPTQRRYVSPNKRITPMQQRYADLRATGVTQGEAAKRAGFKSKASAYKADCNPIVQRYLSGIQEKVQTRVSYRVEEAVQELDKAIGFSYQQEAPQALAKLLELKAKLYGLLIDRVEVVSIDLSGALQQAAQRVLTHASPAPLSSAQPDEGGVGDGVGAEIRSHSETRGTLDVTSE